MKRVSTSRVAAVIAIAVSIVLAASQAQADGKRKRSGTNVSLSVLQKNTSAVGDVPGHEVAQQVTIQHTTKSSDPIFVGQQVTSFDQVDETAGNGTHRGYSMGALKDGSNGPTRYEGTHKTTVKADGAWEWIGEGKYWLLPGTGKLKNQKGEGTYKCKITAEGGGCDWEEESEY